MLHGPFISSFFGLTAPLVAGKGYKLWSSSSWNFIHSPIKSSISRQNIPPSIISSNTLNAPIFLLTVWHFNTTENCSLLKPKIRETTCAPRLSGNLSHRQVRMMHFQCIKLQAFAKLLVYWHTADCLFHRW